MCSFFLNESPHFQNPLRTPAPLNLFPISGVGPLLHHRLAALGSMAGWRFLHLSPTQEAMVAAVCWTISTGLSVVVFYHCCCFSTCFCLSRVSDPMCKEELTPSPAWEAVVAAT